MHFFWPGERRQRFMLLALLVVALALRLKVWQWHALYPLGGDEQDYFNQALLWLQGKGYHDLPLMRPPLYPVFLAGVFRLFDSQVQRVRLVQALISAGTVYLQWPLARLALGKADATGRAALVAVAFGGLSYTLAANATELLTETTFLFGLTLVFSLLLLAWRANRRRWQIAALAGGCAGLLALLRSVGLPLLPLGGLWLLLGRFARCADGRSAGSRAEIGWAAAAFLLGGALAIAPWTARNMLIYGRPIIVDTTGAENLWLDNDPGGREPVKRALLAMGEDRGARQTVALQRGLAAIAGDPARFVRKMGGEARKLLALEYWDQMRDKPGIWIPPLEVWLRLLLGDGLWLLLLLAGSAGLWLLRDRYLLLLFVPWALYVVATNLIFHVELRYRLPLYPVLGVAAASCLTGAGRPRAGRRPWRVAGASATVAAAVALILLHRPYLNEGAMLAQKHWRLWRGDGPGALRADPESALARVQIARDEIARCRQAAAPCDAAAAMLREAIEHKPAHPYAHLLLGGLLRQGGATEAARTELGYETASREDLQHWMARGFGPRGERRLEIGDGLDLGDIEGFYPASDGYRWTKDRATVWFDAPSQPARLRIRLASGRPAGSAPVTVRLSRQGEIVAEFQVGPQWQEFEAPLPAEPARSGGSSEQEPSSMAISIETPTFRPRELDRTNDDNRALGVKVDWVEIVPGSVVRD
jgi:4-amino-4-deoxy-L-arabinose transferase-like glycosyltransferase